MVKNSWNDLWWHWRLVSGSLAGKSNFSSVLPRSQFLNSSSKPFTLFGSDWKLWLRIFGKADGLFWKLLMDWFCVLLLLLWKSCGANCVVSESILILDSILNFEPNLHFFHGHSNNFQIVPFSISAVPGRSFHCS